jgi:hypothetical protein
MKSFKVSLPIIILTFVLIAAIITIGMNISYIDAQKLYFKKYENKDYNITIDYPSKWKNSENNLAQNQIVIFSAPEVEEKESSVSTIIYIPARVVLASQQTPSNNMTLENFTNYFIDSAYSSPDEYKIINTSKTTLAGNEAVELLMYEYVDDKTSKVMRVISLFDNDTAYMIKYIAEPGKFSKYLPIVQQMIDSFQPTTFLKNNITVVNGTTQERKNLIEIPTTVSDSNLIAKPNEPLQDESQESDTDTENNNVISNSGVEPDDNIENNNATSSSGVEKVTVKAQLKSTFLKNSWDIKKFRLAVSDGSEICPSNNCEYRVEDGTLYNFGDLGYSIGGKLKVTIPEDGSSKSTLYPLGLTMDKTGEEETHGQRIQKFSGTFEVGPHITYTITNATLEVNKKSPILSIQGERTSSGNFTDDSTNENTSENSTETTLTTNDDNGNSKSDVKDQGDEISGGLGSLLGKASKKLKEGSK